MIRKNGILYNPVFINFKNLDEVLNAITVLRSKGFKCRHEPPYKVLILCEASKTSELFKLSDTLKTEYVIL